jgi:hypothetical protein
MSMKLVNLLSSVIVEDAKRKNKKLVMEVSQKVLQQLIDKYKGENSSLKDDDIIAKIEEFEKYKNQLPVDKRDLFKLTYAELSDILSSKESKKTSKDLFTQIKDNSAKAGDPPVENAALKRAIRQLMDISGEVPKEKMNLSKITFLKIVEFLNANYLRLLIAAMKKKFPDISDDIIEFYASSYADNNAEIPADTKPIKNLTFQEIERIVDAIEAKKAPVNTGQKSKFDVDMVFPAEGQPDIPNLEIYAPKGKPDCIKLKNGRSWCISREGGSNLYYNYRLDYERTIYYVIDGDKPFSDANYAVVILVDPRGNMALADGTNDGVYSGHQNIPWSQIVSKIPKLDGLEGLFRPKPLTAEEQEILRKYRRKSVSGDDIVQELGSYEDAEIWMEVNSPTLSDEQFGNLPDELQKKYIALGQDLTAGMISRTGGSVLSYYISKKKDTLKTKSLKELSDADIQLLNTQALKGLKEERKNEFYSQLDENSNKITGGFSLEYPKNNMAKFIDLYGFDDVLKLIPESTTRFNFTNTSNTPINLVFPESFAKLDDLKALSLNNCVNEVPEIVTKLKNLQILTFVNCPNITVAPDFLADLPIMALVFRNCNPNMTIEPKLAARLEEGDILWAMD